MSFTFVNETKATNNSKRATTSSLRTGLQRILLNSLLRRDKSRFIWALPAPWHVRRYCGFLLGYNRSLFPPCRAHRGPEHQPRGLPEPAVPAASLAASSHRQRPSSGEGRGAKRSKQQSRRQLAPRNRPHGVGTEPWPRPAMNP